MSPDAAPPGAAVRTVYTKRLPIVQPFSPEEGEDRLYHLVWDYLRREQLIPEIESKLQQRVSRTTLFSIRWKLA